MIDPAGISAIVGVCIVTSAIAVMYFREKCRNNESETFSSSNPLLVRKKSFKVKDLFEHVKF